MATGRGVTYRRIRRVAYTALMLVGALLWIAALLLLAETAQNSQEFGRLQILILLINIAGVLVLLLLIAANFVRLVREYRNHVPGARLKARMVSMFVALVLLPVVMVYGFAVHFLNRGIDSWFAVELEEGFEDALELSRTAMGIQMRELLTRTQEMGDELEDATNRELVGKLGRLRRESGAKDLSLFAANSRIVATSSENPSTAQVAYPSEDILLQLRQGRPFVSLEPLDDGGFEIRTAVRLSDSRGNERILQGIFGVDLRVTRLANRVETSYNEYRELAFLRTPLKYTFTLTLSLVLLMALLAAVYGAFFSARRMVVPIQKLVAGTRAVAKGDFDTRLPVAARDEIGFLVNSFNDMTTRLARADEEMRLSQQQVEGERARLAVILARLSTGVISLENDLRVRTVNQAAGAILATDPGQWVGQPLAEVANDNPLARQLIDVCRERLERGEREWRQQITLQGEVGRRVLMCACTSLPGEANETAGFVVVFDDITALMQAQRDAAWGEVARRLAHEIKNPLTPIQLSAERLRRKYLQVDEIANEQLLDRATHTIIQQVEAMKDMVNAFSDYARAPDMELTSLDINELIKEIAELYRHQDPRVALKLELADDLPDLRADSGRMRQIFHNLMRNAFEAMESTEAGELLVATQLRDDGATPAISIRFSDNGPGFRPDTLAQIFDPYVTTKPKGTGLGLAIVKKLVEEHGGTIRAWNAERGGAQISILIPVAGADSQALRNESGVEHQRERA